MHQQTKHSSIRGKQRENRNTEVQQQKKNASSQRNEVLHNSWQVSDFLVLYLYLDAIPNYGEIPQALVVPKQNSCIH